MSEVESLLLSLLTQKSVSEEELTLCNYLYNFLIDKNFLVEKVPVDENGFNIVIKEGNPKIFFSTHLDTVKGHLEVKEDEEFIYGRGACDAKGCVAAMICAAIECKKEGWSNFGLIFTVGEETNFRGVRKVAEIINDISFIIVGEPTSLNIVNKHHGILSLEILSKGKKAHSSNPEEGENAINKLVEAISKIKEIIIHPESSMSICKIQGGIANNIIPDHAEATISFRISPNDKIDYFHKINDFIKDDVKVKKINEIESVSTEIPSEISFIPNVRTVKYATELSVYRKGIVLGPGDIKYAHTDEERINKKELKKAVNIYKQIIINYNQKSEIN